MGRRRTAVLLAVALLCGLDASAKFGISKTRVTLRRTKPPEIPILGETVAVEVTGGRTASDAAISIVRSRVRDGLEGSGLRVVERPREADAVVRITLDSLEVRLRESVTYEERYVKIGEKQVWNEKKQKYETKDVWGNRREPVTVTAATGDLSATVEVDSGGDHRSADASASYNEQFKEGKVATEARSEEALEHFLVEEAANRAVGVVAFAPDPVEALLAVDGELKNGNRLAEAGLFDQALQEWSRKRLKGDTEAARVHNIGVAHEALAYALPLHSGEHRTELEKAREHYQMALSMDPDEKYFTEPMARIETSLGYAGTAVRIAEDRDRFTQSGKGRRLPAKDDPSPRSEDAADRASGPRSDAPRPSAGSLRNGSFESSLEGWSVDGKGKVLREGQRGQVAELAAASGAASLNQALGLDLEPSGAAALNLEYKVTGGEPRISVVLDYADKTGRDRTSTLEITAGEGPGAWSPWTGDVGALRPRPARVKSIRIVVDGGIARVDNVALTLR
jgi:hypothetical protein